MPAPWEDWQASEQPKDVAPWENWQTAKPDPKAPYDWNSESWIERLGQVTPFRQMKAIGNAAYEAAIGPGEAMAGRMPMYDESGHTSPQAIQYGANTALLASPAPPRVVGSLAAAAAPTAAALAESYGGVGRGYNALKPGGAAYAEYNPQAVAGNAAAIKQYLENENFRGGRAPATHAALDEMATVPNVPGATPISSIHDLQYGKQVLGDINADFGRYSNADRAAAAIAKRKVNEFIAEPPASAVVAGDPALAAQTLAAADKDFAAKQRSDLITGTRETAEGRAAQANSGKNIDNTIRRGVGRILDSDSLSYGFTPKEIEMMESVRHGTASANTMRYVGNLLGGGGGLGAMATSAAGAWYSPFLAPLPFIGAMLKKGADRSTIRGLEKVDEATRMRSAMGEALMNMPGAPNSLQAVDPKRAMMIKALMSPQPQEQR